jgi:hypothetical protein
MTASRRYTSALALLAVLAALLTVPSHVAHAATLLSLNKPATASSSEGAAFPASAVVDGDTGTRWSSAFGDPQRLQVDLGSPATTNRVVPDWDGSGQEGQDRRVSPIHPPGEHPGGMAKTAEPMGVVHSLSRSASASLFWTGTNWRSMSAW